MDLNQFGEIKQAIASLRCLVMTAMDSTTQIMDFGEIKQALVSLTNFVTSAMEVGQLEPTREERRRDEGPDQMQSPLDRARARVRHIFAESTYGNPLCLRCGGKGHIAKKCCNPLICFACEKIGHISRNCRGIAQTLKSQYDSSLDSKHKVLSFTVNFHIGQEGVGQKMQNSHWVWKRKENQEKKDAHQEDVIVGEQNHALDDNRKDNLNEYRVERGGSSTVIPLQTIPIEERLNSMEAKDIEHNGAEGTRIGESSIKVMPLATMPLDTNLNNIEAKEIDYSEVKGVGNGKHGVHEGQKENKGEQEYKEEKDKYEPTKIKVKKEKSKKKKKEENEKKWLVTRDDQGRIVINLV